MSSDSRTNLSREEHNEVMFSIPGSYWLLAYMEAVKGGDIPFEDNEWFDEIIRGIIFILYRASANDTDARKQMKAIHKLVYPDSYSIPRQVISRLADKQKQQAFIVRGTEIFRIMNEIAFFVDSAEAGKSVFKGAVKLTSRPLALNQFNYTRVRDALNNLTAKATLQSLAIRIYHDNLQSEGVDIKESSLLRDLKKFRRWVAGFKSNEIGSGVSFNGENIKLPTISADSWKDFIDERRGGDRAKIIK